MKHVTPLAVAVLLLVSLVAHRALALSRELHDPEIFFPKSFDPQKAALITAPDTLTIRINLAAPDTRLDQLKLPVSIGE